MRSTKLMLFAGTVMLLAGCGDVVHLDMGNRLEQSGQLSEAIEEYRKACQDKPKSLAPHLALGKALLKSGDEVEAIQPSKEGVEADPHSVEARLALGTAYLKHGAAAEAKSELDAADLYAPGTPEVLVAQGQVLEQQSDLQGAIDKYRQAVKANPKLVEAHELLAAVLGKTNEFDEAKKELDLAEKLKAELAAKPKS